MKRMEWLDDEEEDGEDMDTGNFWFCGVVLLIFVVMALISVLGEILT